METHRIISATEAVRQGKQWSELRTDGGWLCWLEFDPANGATRIRARHHRHTADVSRLITPEGFSARSRVHEYGGGALCLLPSSTRTSADTQVVFVNESDQQLYVQAFSASATPMMLPTCSPRCRFGDLVPDPTHQRVLAVRETHPTPGCVSSEVTNELVAVSLNGDQQLLASGKDFYSSPRISQDGRFLVWLSWNHPKQPWLSTTLTLARLGEKGDVVETVDLVNAGGEDISVFQPEFDASGHVVFVCDVDVSDTQTGRDGWWSLYRYQFEPDTFQSGDFQKLQSADATGSEREFGVAQWQLGLRTWAMVPSGPNGSALGDGSVCLNDSGEQTECLLASYVERGLAGISLLNMSTAQWVSTDERQARCHSLVGLEHDNQACVAFLMESATEGTQLVRIPLRSVLGSDSRSDSGFGADGAYVIEALGGLELEQRAQPQPFAYPVNQTEQAFGFYYPAMTTSVRHSAAKPPLLIQLHGGPTAMADTSFDAMKYFWQQRGFSLLVLNYRGSSGFGRAYRHRLHQNWGVTDVEDVQAAILYAIKQEWADPSRVFVRGNSAGGYTVLRVLGSENLIKHNAAASADVSSHVARAVTGSVTGGASHYGISDLLRLNASTHKFESHYLSWLIGDPETDSERFIERSPIHQGVCRPVIFFQGKNDRVVPQDQTLMLHQQLIQQGIQSEHCLFSGEGHGFRQAHHREEVLLRELAFYRHLMD